MSDVPMIQLEGVCKNLGGKQVLDGLDLSIRAGETMVIVGSSGTGKSVTLKHMVGLMYPDEGRVLVNGDDITIARGKQLARIRQRFGMLFQSGALINWMTVYENVALPLREHTDLSESEIRERVAEKLALVELEGSEKKRPSEISGGMKKRVGLTRAIVHEPDIVLYDEPTSGLDPVMSRNVDHLIVSLQEKLQVTSVVVTHDLHSAFTIADRVAMLVQGKVAEVLPPEAFAQSKHESVRAFVKAQFEGGNMKGIYQ